MKQVHTVTPAELLAQLAAENGTVHVPNPEPAVRAGYRRAIHRIVAEQLTPPGLALRHTGRDRGDLTIRLVSNEPAGTPDRPAKLPVPATSEGAPADVIALAHAGTPPGFSTGGWERTLLILCALAAAATARGYGFAVRREGDLTVDITIGDDTEVLLLAEELERRNIPDETAAAAVKYDWQRVPTHAVRVPTGRLQIRTTEHYGAKTWADRQRWRLEDKLGEVFALAEQRCRQAAARRQRAQEYAREQRRIWDEAVPRAQARYAEQVNRERLDTQVEAWRRAQDYVAYATALESLAKEGDMDDARRAELREWISFIHRQATEVDPRQAVAQLRSVVPETPAWADVDRFMPPGMTVLRPPSP